MSCGLRLRKRWLGKGLALKWNSLIERIRGPQSPHSSVSFVFLESGWKPLTDEALLERAQAAYRAAAPKGGISILEKRTASSRVIKMESFFFAYHQARQTYARPLSEAPENIQQAWNNHVSWSSIDWIRPELEEKDKAAARKLLLPLVAYLWGSHVTGLFFPDHGLTVPNLGTLADSIRWSRKNGVPVQELFPPQSNNTD